MFPNKSIASTSDIPRSGITVVDALLRRMQASQNDREFDQRFLFRFT